MKIRHIRFVSSKQVNFSKLGIPLEIFRKKRALGYKKDNLHFSETTLKMIRSSNAHTLVKLIDSK